MSSSFENPKILGGVGSPQSVFETSTKKHHAFGTVGYFDDGRQFRYARLTDTTAIGAFKLAQQAPPVANHVTETGTLTGVAVGDRKFTAVLGATAATADQYADGFLKIQSATTTGAGQIFKIVGHDAVLSGGTITLELYNPVIVAIAGTVTWSLIANPYGGIVIQPTTITAPAAGTTLVDWSAASTSAPLYGWVQTKGTASCLIDTTDVVAGSGLIVGATAGTLGVAVETDIKDRIAIATEAMTTNSVYVTCDLKID